MHPRSLSDAALRQLVTAYHRSMDGTINDGEAALLSLLDADGAPDLRLYTTERVCQPGEIILRENEPGESIYFIRSGAVAVIKGNLDAPTILAFRSRGGMIGEMALLENQPRSATVVALEPVILWRMNRVAFEQLSTQNPHFMLNMMRILSARLRRSDEVRSQEVETGRLREERLRQAQEQAVRDSLTGLFNRRYLEETLHREIARAWREGMQVGILMIDIDYFKQVNDTYGHLAGDAVLRALGVLLSESIRAEDIACRYGGEEFVVVMPGAPLPVICERAERIRRAFQDLRVTHARHEVCATLSIGAAVYPSDGATGIAVLACADQALYRAKAAGRNQVALFNTA